MVTQSKGSGQCRTKAEFGGASAKSSPALVGGEIVTCDHAPRIPRIQARPFVVLDLEDFKCAHVFVGSSYNMEQLTGVADHDSCGVRSQQLDGRGHQGRSKVDVVEILDHRFHCLDNGGGE